MAAIPLLGWTLFTGVCAIPMLKGTRMLAEWLEERPDGSVVKGSSNALIPAMSSLLAFGALAYGFGFGGIAGIAGGATTGSEAQSFSPPNTPTIDITVFADTNDSVYWLGSVFSADPGDTHDSTQVQIDTIGTNNWSGSTIYTDSVYLASERDTVPPVSNSGRALQADAVNKARLRYYAREGGWSAWSDSIEFTMSQYAVPTTPSVDIVVFAATHDSLFWLGSPFNGAAGDSHDSTQVQIDSVGAAFGTNVFHDATTSALERDTLPPVSDKTLPAYQARPDGGDVGGGSWPATGGSYNAQLKARIRYKGQGGWSAWSDSATFTMAQTLETFGSPVIDEDFEYYEIIDSLNSCNACNDGAATPWSQEWIRDGGGAGGSGAYIDTTTGYNGRRHSLRFDFYVADSSLSQTIGRQLDFDDNGVADQTEIWLEFPIRYDTDFRTNPLGTEAGPGDHKLLFGNTTQNSTLRWEFKVGTNTWLPNNPNSVVGGHAGTNSTASNFRSGWNAQDTFWDDGEWHNVRIHWKHSVPANATNGIQEYWIDGDSAWAQTGFATLSSDYNLDGTPKQDYIHQISMGRNKDDGPTAKLISLWWGYMKVWTSDPGW